MSLQTAPERTTKRGQMLRRFVQAHPASSHPLFDRLEEGGLSLDQAGALLRNYDAHASHLRRLLLKAATIMPEEAVGYILENVRNEYGNGRPEGRHQLQLQSLAWAIGVLPEKYRSYAITPGIKQFIKQVTPYYYPIARPQGKASPDQKLAGNQTSSGNRTSSENLKPSGSRAAIAAGAITATELLALEEFKSLQKAFAGFGQEHHIWFDHVTIECEHLEDSVSLALYFLEQNRAPEEDVLLGLSGVLDATVHLYDGLLACLD